MKILGIDTSTRFLCVGISEDSRLIAEYNAEVGPRYSSTLISAIKELLKKNHLTLKQIDGFATGIGPGSFTGLRIGVTTMKALAFSLRKPLVAVSSLDVIAKNIIFYSHTICPIVDARRNLIYSCFYKLKDQMLQRKSPYLLLRPQDILRRLKTETIFLGDGLLFYQEYLKERLQNRAEFAKEEYWYPKAKSLLLLAGEKFRKDKLSDPYKLVPLYLYPKECQIRNV